MGISSDFTHHTLREIKERPKDIIQLNESVYQLYSSHRSTPDATPKVVVIFFHGLPSDHPRQPSSRNWFHNVPPLDDWKEAFWTTWLSRDGTAVWPKAWLGESLEGKGIQAQLLSVSYDSDAYKHPGEMDTYQIAENLISDIILDPESGISQDCPVVLVGHCLGGIVIKEFLLGCLKRRGLLSKNEKGQRQLKRIENFMGNCKGVFYYSTPNVGTKVVDYLAEMSRRKLNDGLINLLKTLNQQTARINNEFASARGGEGIRTQAILEGLDTTYMGFKGKFVEEASARLDVEGLYTDVTANHFDVCRARNNKWCNIHQHLRDFIKTAAEDNESRFGGR